MQVGPERRRAADMRTYACGGLAHTGGVLVQKSAHAAAGSFAEAWPRLLVRRLVSTMPTRITSMPMTIGRDSVSCRSTTPQNTAVTGTKKVTPVGRTGPSVFIV